MSPRNWRERPPTRRVAHWRPWYSWRPRRRGARINEPQTKGLRDLVAPPGEIQGRPLIRWRIVGAFFVLLFALLIVRLVFLQVVDHAAAVAAASQNYERVYTLPAARGEIRDRYGNVLVGNVYSTQLQLSRAEALAHPSVVGALAALLNLPIKTVNARLSNVQYEPYQPVPITTTTAPAVVEYVKLHPTEFPGVEVVNAASRDYLLGGSLAPYILGFVSDSSDQGVNGVEKYYQSFLHGRTGHEVVKVNTAGTVLGTTKLVEPRVGDSLVLNIDAGLQNAVDEALSTGVERVRTHVDPVSGVYPKAPNAAAIVMDVKTGAVLALASYPSYNVASFSNGLTPEQYKQIEEDGSLNDYAIQGEYTPGSTFKLVTATTELQTGIMSASQYVDDTGTFKVPGCLQGAHGCVFHDDQDSGDGIVNLPLALTRSSDYYFYNLGYLFWANQARYGKTPIQNVAAKYGLGTLTGIDLPYEVEGRVDSPQERELLHSEAPKAFPTVSWYTGDNIEMAFGQGATAVTPIEMAQAYATFANGGTRYAPEVAAGVVSPTGKVIERYAPRVTGHVALPGGVRTPILEGLEGVVNNPTGTAYAPFHEYATFNLNDYVIAGKTGTASNQANQEPNSWFVGFGPNPNPTYVVLCVIDQGGYGADGAAPVVAQIFNYLVKHPVGSVNLTAVHTTTSLAHAAH